GPGCGQEPGIEHNVIPLYELVEGVNLSPTNMQVCRQDRRQFLVKLAVTGDDLHFLRYAPLEDTVLFVLRTELIILLSVAAGRWVWDHDKLGAVTCTRLQRAEIGAIEQVHSSL